MPSISPSPPRKPRKTSCLTSDSCAIKALTDAYIALISASTRFRTNNRRSVRIHRSSCLLLDSSSIYRRTRQRYPVQCRSISLRLRYARETLWPNRWILHRMVELPSLGHGLREHGFHLEQWHHPNLRIQTLGFRPQGMACLCRLHYFNLDLLFDGLLLQPSHASPKQRWHVLSPRWVPHHYNYPCRHARPGRSTCACVFVVCLEGME